MPRSKRDRTVALTRTRKKSKDQKSTLIDRLREAVDSFDTLYVMSFSELRATHLKDVRVAWRDSRS